jgi:hypothetical protein
VRVDECVPEQLAAAVCSGPSRTGELCEDGIVFWNVSLSLPLLCLGEWKDQKSFLD